MTSGELVEGCAECVFVFPFVLVTDVPAPVRCHFDEEPRRLRVKSQKKNSLSTCGSLLSLPVPFPFLCSMTGSCFWPSLCLWSLCLDFVPRLCSGCLDAESPSQRPPRSEARRYLRKRWEISVGRTIVSLYLCHAACSRCLVHIKMHYEHALWHGISWSTKREETSARAKSLREQASMLAPKLPSMQGRKYAILTEDWVNELHERPTLLIVMKVACLLLGSQPFGMAFRHFSWFRPIAAIPAPATRLYRLLTSEPTERNSVEPRSLFKPLVLTFSGSYLRWSEKVSLFILVCAKAVRDFLCCSSFPCVRVFLLFSHSSRTELRRPVAFPLPFVPANSVRSKKKKPFILAECRTSPVRPIKSQNVYGASRSVFLNVGSSMADYLLV